MDIDITILGNQIKIEGAPVFDGDPVYHNISDVLAQAKIDIVVISDYLNNY